MLLDSTTVAPLCACGCGQPVNKSQNYKGWSRFRRGHQITPCRTVAERFWATVQKTDNCWLWTGSKDKDGYGQFGIGNKTIKPHRLSWELHFGSIPDGGCVCHHCDNPPCVNPAHLFLGTHEDNVRDMNRKGRNGSYLHPESRPRGERNASSKLTAFNVTEMRLLYSEGISAKILGEQFGIKRQAAWAAIHHRTWRHVL